MVLLFTLLMSPCLFHQCCAHCSIGKCYFSSRVYSLPSIFLSFHWWLLSNEMTDVTADSLSLKTMAEKGHDHCIPLAWSTETRFFLPSLRGHSDLLNLVYYCRTLSLYRSLDSPVRMSITVCQTITGEEYWKPDWLCNLPWWLTGHTWPYLTNTGTRSGPSSIKDWGKQCDECLGPRTRQAHESELADWPWANNLTSQISSFLILKIVLGDISSMEELIHLPNTGCLKWSNENHFRT